MAGVNKVLILGNLGKDPELRYTPNQKPVCTFSVATSEKEGEREVTEWHNITVFGATAENCGKFLKKGSKVFVEGKLKTESWDDKETGKKRFATKIISYHVTFLDAAQVRKEESKQQKQNEAPTTQLRENMFDDVPF